METGEPILEELTQELERANQEILRLKGYAISTGLASSASAEGKSVRLRGIAISEGTHNGKYYPWEELSKNSFVDSFQRFYSRDPVVTAVHNSSQSHR